MESTWLDKILTPTNIFFFSIIIYLAFEDVNSHKTAHYRDYKSLIVSVGLLGTFTGIFIGLLNFDTNDLKSIQSSIPMLLSGLQTAFITSITGMATALFLSFYQKKFSSKSEMNDEVEILNSINSKLLNIDNGLSESNQKVLDTLHLNFNRINISIEKAMENLSKGATEEIIKALEDVIKDFNNNLTEQFGDNFKQLNESVLNMIKWQEQYKNDIEVLNNYMKETIKSLQATDNNLLSMLKSFKDIEEIHLRLERILSESDNRVKEFNEKMKTQVEIAEQLKVTAGQAQEKINKTLDSFLEGNETIVIGFNDTKQSIDDVSKKMQASLEKQSQALTDLTKNLENELPKSLGMLGEALTSMTAGFKKDYSAFLDHFGNLLERSYR